MMTNKIILILLLILSFTLTSCDNDTDNPDSSVSTNESAIVSAVPTPTEAIIPSPIPPSPTSTITATPIPTLPEPTPSQTPSPTETATPTRWPTPLPGEEVDHVLALLQDNQNPDCLLPCWWGAVPGQTYWPDISPYLSSFAQKIEFFPEQSVYVTMFSVPENIDNIGRLNIGFELNASEIVTTISIASVNIADYDPRTMMALYGIPDDVWLKTFSEVLQGDVLPFHLIIVYQEKGIGFFYYVGASVNDGTVTRCFEPGIVETERPDLFPAGPRIYLWEPGEYKTANVVAGNQEVYRRLENKTDLTPQTFYEKFTDLNESPCIDTPTKLWEGELLLSNIHRPNCSNNSRYL